MSTLNEQSPGSNPDRDVQVNEISVEDAADWMTSMLRSTLFSRIPAVNLQQIFARFAPLSVKEGDQIVTQGEVGDYYYVVRDGRCIVTRKAPSAPKHIKLADLGPGDRIGEESLISGARREATVTMLSDGQLMRLTKEDFIELIKDPLLASVQYARAQQMIREGAFWLDIRFPHEHRESGIEGSINLSLTDIRANATNLEKDKRYIAYCDSGARSSVGTFLLVERGFEVTHLDGGLAASGRQQVCSTGAAEAHIESSVLKAELEKTNIELRKAVRLKEEAEKAKLIAEEKVRVERLRLQEKAQRVKDALSESQRLKEEVKATQRVIEEKVLAERAQMEKKAKQASAALSEVQRIKQEVEVEKKSVVAEMAQHQREEERIRRLNEETKERLHDAEARLGLFYAKKAKDLTSAQKLRDEAEAELKVEREKLAAQSAEAKRQLARVRRSEKELELSRLGAAKEAKMIQERQRLLEKKLRDEFEERLEEKREQLEQEFARNAQQLKVAQREKAVAEAAQRSGTEEAQRIIAEYKAAYEERHNKEQANTRAERQRLEREAVKIQQALAQAQRIRQEAERVKQTADRHAASIRSQLKTADGTSHAEKARMEAKMTAIETEVGEATQNLSAAQRTQRQTEAAHQANLEDLDRQQQQEQLLHREIEADVQGWVREQELFLTSEEQQRLCRERDELMKRINQRTEEAKRQTKQHDQDLLNEMAVIQRCKEDGHSLASGNGAMVVPAFG